jgi:hypothetical protein
MAIRTAKTSNLRSSSSRSSRSKRLQRLQQGRRFPMPLYRLLVSHQNYQAPLLHLSCHRRIRLASNRFHLPPVHRQTFRVVRMSPTSQVYGLDREGALLDGPGCRLLDRMLRLVPVLSRCPIPPCKLASEFPWRPFACPGVTNKHLSRRPRSGLSNQEESLYAIGNHRLHLRG